MGYHILNSKYSLKVKNISSNIPQIRWCECITNNFHMPRIQKHKFLRYLQVFLKFAAEMALHLQSQIDMSSKFAEKKINQSCYHV